MQKTIHDPRLVAVFQAAGRSSRAFRVAQIQTAKRSYYPAADPITVTLPGGATLTGRVGDVLRSEAGMATAFDRKVNTGHAAPEVAAAVASVLAAHGLTTLADVAPYEREVIAALKYRADFLADKTLTQPPDLAPPRSGGSPSIGISTRHAPYRKRHIENDSAGRHAGVKAFRVGTYGKKADLTGPNAQMRQTSRS